MRSSPPPFTLAVLQDRLSPSPELTPLSSLLTRKRHFSAADAFSSDPVFSDEYSDAELPSEEPRRKRVVRLPWWELRARRLGAVAPQPTAQQKRLRSRAFDSGVWMNSDEDWRSIEEDFGQQDELATPPASDPTAMAISIIQRCIEHGDATIDLSALCLQDLDYKTLQPLELFMHRSSTDCNRPPSEDQYTSLRPNLQLYLSNNRLQTIPSNLSTMHITVLSLRNNMLRELPSSIGYMESLKELNVAGNQLEYLPKSLKRRYAPYQPRRLTMHPNPFLSCTLSQDEHAFLLYTTGHHKLRDDQLFNEKCYRKLIYLRSSRTTYFDVAGRVSGSSRPEAQYAPCLEAQPVTREGSTGYVPSLFELSLRRAQRAQLPEDVTQLLPDDRSSAVLLTLQKASDGRRSVNERCSECGSEMIVARAEWMEYWFFGQVVLDIKRCSETVVPFLKRVCSVKCAGSKRHSSPTSRWLQEQVK